jgi:hypothetical protein
MSRVGDKIFSRVVDEHTIHLYSIPAGLEAVEIRSGRFLLMNRPAQERVHRQQVEHLRRQLSEAGVGWSQNRSACSTWVSSGCAAWDASLPQQRGFRRGGLVEWFAVGAGHGAGTLALLVARQACSGGGALIVVDPADDFYPPAAAAYGIDLQQLMVVRPQRMRDVLWTWDQALRCPAVGAVWGWLEAIDDRWFRRLQLASEHAQALGLLLRPGHCRGAPSWAELQLAVAGRSPVLLDGSSDSPRAWRVELLRGRGSSAAAVPVSVDLELREPRGQLEVIHRTFAHETSALHLVSELAHPAFPGHSSRT